MSAGEKVRNGSGGGLWGKEVRGWLRVRLWGVIGPCSIMSAGEKVKNGSGIPRVVVFGAKGVEGGGG